MHFTSVLFGCLFNITFQETGAVQILPVVDQNFELRMEKQENALESVVLPMVGVVIPTIIVSVSSSVTIDVVQNLLAILAETFPHYS